MDTKIEIKVETPEFFYSQDTCRYCGKVGKHWSLTCTQSPGASEVYSAKQPQPTLEEAKQRYYQAKLRYEEAQLEFVTAKGVLARVVYDEQTKLDTIKKSIFGEISD